VHNILLVITGSIAAYKGLDLIRKLRELNYNLTPILTKGGAEFITPLSAASLAGNKCYTDLFDLKDETEMGHINLSREADLILVAPASADFIAKLANGNEDDLASTVLLAANKQVMIAPAMNTKMYEHASTQANLKKLDATIINPAFGELACGEQGTGKMADVADIVAEVDKFFGIKKRKLQGKKVLLTNGATQEPIDPVRYITNHSSGLQGVELTKQLLLQGADVTVVSGICQYEYPKAANIIKVQNAQQMHDAVMEQLPADIFFGVAAVGDYRVAQAADNKIKKANGGLQTIELVENPDILKAVSNASNRPNIVVGFCAETEQLLDNATLKLQAKGCDYIIANNASNAGDIDNEVIILSNSKQYKIAKASKTVIAKEILEHILHVSRET